MVRFIALRILVLVYHRILGDGSIYDFLLPRISKFHSFSSFGLAASEQDLEASYRWCEPEEHVSSAFFAKW